MTSLIMKPFADLAAELTSTLLKEVEGGPATSAWTPAVDIYEDENHLTIVADLPGVDPKTIEMKIQGDILWFRGERKSDYGHKTKLFCAERISGPYLRTLPLPRYVESEGVKAHCENGALTITLPKKPEAKPKQITIEG